MFVGHFAPFAPSRCGLYEAARDMCFADALAGYNSLFFDTGVISGDTQAEMQVGAVDERGSFKLVTSSLEDLNKLDLVIAHTGVNDNWLARIDCPVIWVLHGRPLACFRTETQGRHQSYSLCNTVANWKRVKKLLYFWDEFTPYWENALPRNKLHCLEFPPIDNYRFNQDGEKYKLKNPGKYNILICDSMREDFCNYEIVNNLIEVCKRHKGIKIHFFGAIDFPIANCWNILLNKLKELDSLGDIEGRITFIENIYRSVDLVVSPNKIITRTIGEAISCGIPTLAQQPNKISAYGCDIFDTKDFINAFEMFKEHKDNNFDFKTALKPIQEKLSLENYNKSIKKLYEEVLK